MSQAGGSDKPARGRFITLEGGEGAGKSTQLRLIADHLRGLGIEVVETREPGGTPGAEAIRTLLLDGEGDRWNPRAEALLFAAARSDHVERVIGPALERGAWVLCDRFVDSNRAYQAGGSGLSDDDVMALHRIGSGGLMPDRTLLLRIGTGAAAERARLRDEGRADRFGARGGAFHDAVAAAFDRQAQTDPDRFRVIDADANPDTVRDRAFAALSDLLP